MTKDEIIEMATQVYGECVWHESALLRLEAFVKLVAAKEREACAKLCDKEAEEWGWSADVVDVAIAIRARGEQACLT